MANLILHHKSLFLPPTATHSWAQSDWYALALGFLDNGLDFFHPQVGQLNLQFPSDLDVQQWSGKTSVDFPIIPCIVACLMKLLGSESYIIFRAVTFLISLLGLFYLFRVAIEYCQNFWLAVLLVSFLNFQPVFTYYMDGFLPTQTAISLFLIGLFHHFRFFRSGMLKNLVYGVLFWTLAALIRLPFVIPLIALMISLNADVILNKRYSKSRNMLYPLLGIGIVGVYFLYNHHLFKMYGSVFLGHPLPVRNVSEFVQYIIIGVPLNMRFVLPLGHVVIVLGLLWTALIGVRWTKGILKKDIVLKLTILFTLLGGLAYALLMSRQLKHHDYYYNDFFLPGLLFLMLYLLGKVRQREVLKVLPFIVVLFSLSSFQLAGEIQSAKYAVGRTNTEIVESSIVFEGSEQFLDQLGISKEAKILVIDAKIPSVGSNTMRRKTFNVRTATADGIKEAMKWPFDYIVAKNSSIEKITSVYSNWENEVVKVADNGKLSVFRVK